MSARAAEPIDASSCSAATSRGAASPAAVARARIIPRSFPSCAATHGSTQDRRPGCPTGSRLRWSQAGRSLSSRRRAPDYASASRGTGRLAFSCGNAANVAFRSLTICHGGSSPTEPGERRHLAPDLTRQRLALRLDEAVGRTDSDGHPVGEGKEPLGGRVEHAEDPREAFWGRDLEVSIEDGAERFRRGKILDQQRRNPTGDRQDDGVVSAKVDLVLTEIERAHAVVRKDRARAADDRSALAAPCRCR